MAEERLEELKDIAIEITLPEDDFEDDWDDDKKKKKINRGGIRGV